LVVVHGAESFEERASKAKKTNGWVRDHRPLAFAAGEESRGRGFEGERNAPAAIQAG